MAQCMLLSEEKIDVWNHYDILLNEYRSQIVFLKDELLIKNGTIASLMDILKQSKCYIRREQSHISAIAINFTKWRTW